MPVLAVVALAAGVIGALISLALFLALDDDAPKRGGVFFFSGLNAPELEEAPFCSSRNAFCLTVDDAGEIIAVYPFETNPYHRALGCDAEWRPDMRFRDPRTGLNADGWFRGRCGGSTHHRHGARVFGPSARNLDRFHVSVTEDGIEVDTRKLICGEVVPEDAGEEWDDCEFAPPPA